MKHAACLIFWQQLLNQAVCAMANGVPNTFRIATFNVRFDSKPDNITVQETIDNFSWDLPGVNQSPCVKRGSTAELPWSTRRVHVANEILGSGARIYVNDMQELLGDEWSWVGVGRNDGKKKGEFNPIFWHRDTFRLHDWDTFWLCDPKDNPFKPCKHPSAGSYRLCTTAKFTHLPTGTKFTLLNTHLDDRSPTARDVGASMLLHRAHYEATTSPRHPVFLTGDFNSQTTEDAYRIVTGETTPIPNLNPKFTSKFSVSEEEEGKKKFVMKDLLGLTPPRYRTGNVATFTGFRAVNESRRDDEDTRIDYVFGGVFVDDPHNDNDKDDDGGVRKGEEEKEEEEGHKWKLERYHVGSNLYDDCVYASDHRPVFVDVTLAAAASFKKKEKKEEREEQDEL